jgi:hypothetical protein
MSNPSLPLRLVSAPPPPRTCAFCGGTLTAIELWHNCPERRLAFGLHHLRHAHRPPPS